MNVQRGLINTCIAVCFLICFSACEKEPVIGGGESFFQEAPQAQMFYFDDEGNLQEAELTGTSLTFMKDGKSQTLDVQDYVNGRTHTTERNTIHSLQGRLENEFRGSLGIIYAKGEGRVRWAMRDGVTIVGDIICMRTIRDQIIMQIEITHSTSGDPFAVGQSVVTTVRDNGRPNPKHGIYDQIAKVMLIYAGPNECMNQFLPNVNDLIGYDDSTGNIDTK